EVFNRIFYILDRCEDGINRNQTYFRIERLVFFCWNISSTFGNGNFNTQLYAGIHTADYQIRIKNLESRSKFANISGGKYFLNANRYDYFFVSGSFYLFLKAN